MKDFQFDSMINRIKEIKKEQKITNAQLAQLSGVPYGTLNKILGSETKEPTLSTIINIADALGVSVDYLLFGENKKSPSAQNGKKAFYESSNNPAASLGGMQEILSNMDETKLKQIYEFIAFISRQDTE